MKNLKIEHKISTRHLYFSSILCVGVIILTLYAIIGKKFMRESKLGNLTCMIHIYNPIKTINIKSNCTIQVHKFSDSKSQYILNKFINVQTSLLYSIKITWLESDFFKYNKKAKLLLYTSWLYQIRKTKKGDILLFKGGMPIRLLKYKEKDIPSKINIIMKEEIEKRVNLYLSQIKTLK